MYDYLQQVVVSIISRSNILLLLLLLLLLVIDHTAFGNTTNFHDGVTQDQCVFSSGGKEKDDNRTSRYDRILSSTLPN